MNKKGLEKIWEHIAKTNSEMGEVKTDIKWLKKIQWFLLTTSVAALVGILFISFKIILGVV